MPRPTTPKEEYIAEIESMLRKWMWIEEITANKLQKLVGGKYSKISEMLEEYKKEYIEKQNEKDKTPQPSRYQDVVLNITDSIKNNLWDAWLTIKKETNEVLEFGLKEFEYRRNTLESEKIDDSRQIKNLENEVDKLKLQLLEQDSKLDEHNKEKSILNTDLKRINNELEKARLENSKLIKELWKIEWKIQMKDEIIKKLEKK